MYMKFLYKTNIRHAAMLIRLRQSQIKMPENVRNGAMKTKVALFYKIDFTTMAILNCPTFIILPVEK